MLVKVRSVMIKKQIVLQQHSADNYFNEMDPVTENEITKHICKPYA